MNNLTGKMFSKLTQIVEKSKRFGNKRFVRYGTPFLVFMVVGSFGLREFTSLRYKFAQNKFITAEEAEQMGIQMKKAGEVTLETEFDKIKDLDIETWENKRGPRPWEENFK